MIYSCNVGTKMFLQIFKILSNFDSNPLICDPTLFPGKSSPNIAKSNRVFPGRREEIEPWFWHIWIAQWLKFFTATVYLFQFQPSSRENEWSKLDQKWKLWVGLFFMKTQILRIFFKQCFFFTRVLPLLRISATLDYILGE